MAGYAEIVQKISRYRLHENSKLRAACLLKVKFKSGQVMGCRRFRIDLFKKSLNKRIWWWWRWRIMVWSPEKSTAILIPVSCVSVCGGPTLEIPNQIPHTPWGKMELIRTIRTISWFIIFAKIIKLTRTFGPKSATFCLLDFEVFLVMRVIRLCRQL